MLGKITVDKKCGNEKFINGVDNTLLDYWSWAHSDVVGNAERGVLAEYIVAMAFDVHRGTRTEWDSYDLTTKDGIKIEVKSSGYIQTWSQKKISSISFGIQPTQALDQETNIYSNIKKRQADIYIFCVHKHKDQETINPLDINQWEFYIISTNDLNYHVSNQKTIVLSKLLKIGAVKTEYSSLRDVTRKIYKEVEGCK